jgi:SAM-dependent methyltransferase
VNGRPGGPGVCSAVSEGAWGAGSEGPRLYRGLAGWFHLLTSPEDYADEAAFYTRVLVEMSRHPVRTVLELGSGGGNNASHMKRSFELTLVDLSAQMLEVSRSINPECEHVQGDMRKIRLGRTFDAVFVHDAVSYMRTEDDLRAVMGTAAAHCRAGGAAVFAPDHTRENFREGTSHGGHDGADGRGLRYLEWKRDPDRSDTEYVMDFAYLLREADGLVRAEYDRHVLGLFPARTWLRLLEESGFEARMMRAEFPGAEVEGHDVIVGVRRG